MFEKMRINISLVFAVLLFALICVSGRSLEDNITFVPSVLFFLGTILVGIASLGRLWCSVYIAGCKTNHLVTQGPYSMCRHPLYFFSLLGAMGVGFATESFLIPFIILIGFGMYYPFVMKSEEARLAKLHKNKFEVYCKKVPKFLPKISYLTEPEKYIVTPIIFRKHIYSALWFIWLIGILEIIENLHEMKVLPEIFKIY